MVRLRPQRRRARRHRGRANDILGTGLREHGLRGLRPSPRAAARCPLSRRDPASGSSSRRSSCLQPLTSTPCSRQRTATPSSCAPGTGTPTARARCATSTTRPASGRPPPRSRWSLLVSPPSLRSTFRRCVSPTTSLRGSPLIPPTTSPAHGASRRASLTRTSSSSIAPMIPASLSSTSARTLRDHASTPSTLDA